MVIRQFARVLGVLAVCALLGATCETKDKPRMFNMGFTPWPYATGLEAMQDTFDRIHAHSDITSFHLDEGVPWVEALNGNTYAAEYEDYLSLLLEERLEGDTVYVGVSSLNSSRNGIALYRGAEGNMELPYPWDTYSFSDDNIVQAYTNFCLELIDRFNPTYFNYAIEANTLVINNPNLDATYQAFLAEVYTGIKAEYPDLMTGISIALRHPLSNETPVTDAFVKDMLPYFDFLGVGVYPYIFFGSEDPGDPTALEKGWLLQAQDMARGKPVAITETAWPAEDLDVTTFGISVDSTPERQEAYVRRVLGAASDIEALFVLWWCVADYDTVWEELSPEAQIVAQLWRDTGLYDETLTARIGLTAWDEWLAKPKE